MSFFYSLTGDLDIIGYKSTYVFFTISQLNSIHVLGFFFP